MTEYTSVELTTEDLEAVRAECRLLSERIISLRVCDPPKGTRRAGLDWLQKRLNALRVRCGGGPGYDDPSDPFADDAFAALQEELNEVQAYGNPYPVPLPEGCVLLPTANFDPFKYGRNYAWRPL